MIVVRQATPDDLHYIVDSWRRSYEGAPAVHGMPKDAYFQWMFQKARALLKAHGAVVACAEDDPATVVGWACVDEGVLHYMLVRKPLRDAGIDAILLEGQDVYAYTHRTRSFQPSAEWQYRPDLAE